MPKCCKECFLQGHDKSTCWNIYLEVHEMKMEEREGKLNKQVDGKKRNKDGSFKNNQRRRKFYKQ